LSFSALQRAENFSIPQAETASAAAARFQCSSASRKFLNHALGFGALQRDAVSVLFSKPKISQS